MKLGLVVFIFRLRPLFGDKSHLLRTRGPKLVLVVVGVGVELDGWLVLGVAVLVLLAHLSLVVLRVHVRRIV